MSKKENLVDWNKNIEDCKKYIVKNFYPGKPLISIKTGVGSGFYSSSTYNSPKIVENNMKKFGLKDIELLSILRYLELNNFIYKIETKETISDASTSKGIFNLNSHNYPDSSTTVAKSGENTFTTYFPDIKLYADYSHSNKLFFAREFNDKKTKEFYNKLKTRIQDELKLEVVMLEEDVVAGNIHSRIKNEIRSCKYFIADLTYEKSEKTKNLINGNVMYEIGMAKAYNKPCLLIMNEEVYPFDKEDYRDSLPFDISSHSVIKYGYNNDDNIESIIKCIKAEFS